MVFSIICEAALNSTHFLKLGLSKPPLSTLYFVENRDGNISHDQVYLIKVVGFFSEERPTKIGNTLTWSFFLFSIVRIAQILFLNRILH